MDQKTQILENLDVLLRCPITGDIMLDPVDLDVNFPKDSENTNKTYEREAIEKWLKNNDTCPLTRNSLKGRVSQNSKVRELIKAFLEENPDYLKDLYRSEALKQRFIAAIKNGDKRDFDRCVERDKRLLKEECEFYTSNGGYTPNNKKLLTFACEEAPLEMLGLVLNRLQQENKTIFEFPNDVLVRGLSLFIKVAERLKTEGAKKMKEVLHWTQPEMQQALISLIKENNVELVKIVLSLGVSVTLELLNESYTSQQLEMVKLLVRSNALIQEKDKDGNDFLMRTIKDGRHEFISFLLTDKEMQISIDINSRNNLKETPLILAAKLSQISTVEILLKHENLNLNEVDSAGKNAIRYSAEKNDHKMGELIYSKLKARGISSNATQLDEFLFFKSMLKKTYKKQEFADYIKPYEDRINKVAHEKEELSKIIIQQEMEIRELKKVTGLLCEYSWYTRSRLKRSEILDDGIDKMKEKIFDARKKFL